MEDHFRKAELLQLVSLPSISKRNKALISFLFVTGARVGEIVKVIKKNQIEFRTINNTPFMFVNDVPIEKRRIVISRNIPINIEKEKAFVDLFIPYLDLLKDDDILFNINRTRVFQIVQKITGEGPHFLRHSRLTNLTVEYNLSPEDLTRVTGWSTWRTAEIYSHKNVEDVAAKMAQ